MSKGILYIRRMMALSLSSLLLVAGIACTGNGATNTILGSVANTAKQSTLMIRVVNDTFSDVEVEMRVDGEMKYLPPCSAVQRSCDYFLTSCPTVVEIIQETRRDDQGIFMGGRNFETNPDWTFGPGEFECGKTLILQFSENTAHAQAM